MRGYGDSDKPAGVEGYDARALAEEARALVAGIGFGLGRPLIHAAHDMGALPALLWTADHPEEVKALLYIEAPVMLGEVLRQVFAYTPEAMAQGSMWWWILPLAPGVPERLIVGNERAFLELVLRGRPCASTTAPSRPLWWTNICGPSPAAKACSEASASIAPPSPASPRPSRLLKAKIATPVSAMGGEKGLGARVGQMVAMVADHVEAAVEPTSGHFLPEEAPEAVARAIIHLATAEDIIPKGDHP